MINARNRRRRKPLKSNRVSNSKYTHADLHDAIPTTRSIAWLGLFGGLWLYLWLNGFTPQYAMLKCEVIVKIRIYPGSF